MVEVFSTMLAKQARMSGGCFPRGHQNVGCSKGHRSFLGSMDAITEVFVHKGHCSAGCLNLVPVTLKEAGSPGLRELDTSPMSSALFSSTLRPGFSAGVRRGDCEPRRARTPWEEL
jgi:hypothetical protein